MPKSKTIAASWCGLRPATPAASRATSRLCMGLHFKNLSRILLNDADEGFASCGHYAYLPSFHINTMTEAFRHVLRVAVSKVATHPRTPSVSSIAMRLPVGPEPASHGKLSKPDQLDTIPDPAYFNDFSPAPENNTCPCHTLTANCE